MVIGLLAMAIVLVPDPIVLAASAEQHFRIEASQFQYTPETLQVHPGDHVTIDLVSTDVVHGLYITASISMSRLIGTAAHTRLWLIVGTFRVRCSVTCGALHPFMIGKLNVGSNDLLWRAIGLGGLAVIAGAWAVGSKNERRPKGER
jgi:heme/copper-type cytochrome/quinol oxidase subunit 2